VTKRELFYPLFLLYIKIKVQIQKEEIHKAGKPISKEPSE
jgi:hypothetical protein